MDLEESQVAFVQLLGQVRAECKIQFLEWLCREYHPVVADGPGDGTIPEEPEPDVLDNIAADLRTAVPPNALAPGETQLFSSQGPNSDLSSSNTLHVDSFLYPTEEDVDSLCRELQVSRNYCLICGSWRTSPLNFISHSMSRDQLRFIFTNLLPDLTGKTVLDIGSRMGPVLYGGYIYSQASRLIGVEMTSFFCELQLKVVSKYHMEDRVQVVFSDVCNQPALLQEADVIVMNNVFELFLTLEQQARVWEFLYQTLRKQGSRIVTIPSIQETCNHLPFKVSLSLDHWITELPTGVDPRDEELNRIHLYCVL